MLKTRQEKLDYLYAWIRVTTERLESLGEDCSGIREDNPDAFADKESEEKYPKIIQIATITTDNALYGLDEDGNVLKAHGCDGWGVWIKNKEHREED